VWQNVGCRRLQGNITGCLECCDQQRSVWVSTVVLLGEGEGERERCVCVCVVCVCVLGCVVCVCGCVCWGGMNEEVNRCKYVQAQSQPSSRHLPIPPFATGSLSILYPSPDSMVCGSY